MKSARTFLCAAVAMATSASAALADSQMEKLNEAVALIAGANACGRPVMQETNHIYKWIEFAFEDHKSQQKKFMETLSKTREAFDKKDCNHTIEAFAKFDLSQFELTRKSADPQTESFSESQGEDNAEAISKAGNLDLRSGPPSTRIC